MIEQRQDWNSKVIYLIADEFGSVQLELYKEKQNFGGTCWLWDLFVLSEYRKQGHAKRLLKRVEEIAKAEGHKDVVMEWDEKNTPYEVLQWYLRSGYRAILERRGYCLLEKKL